jgi:hypothetical protein
LDWNQISTSLYIVRRMKMTETPRSSFMDNLPFIRVRLTMMTDVLGTAPKTESLYTDYVASKAPQDVDTSDELETAPFDPDAKQGWTGFHSDEHGWGVMDYMVKGYLKAACGALRRVDKITLSSQVRAYKKILTELVFPEPRLINFHLPDDYVPPEDVESPGAGIPALPRFERAIRAQTPRGERTALVASDKIPAGSYLDVKIIIMDASRRDLIFELLDYGRFLGLGQWRNGGYGRFTWELLEDGTGV